MCFAQNNIPEHDTNSKDSTFDYILGMGIPDVLMNTISYQVLYRKFNLMVVL